MEKGQGEGLYPQGQAVFLDLPGWGCIHGESAVQLVGHLPTHLTSGKANPMLGLAEGFVTSH